MINNPGFDPTTNLLELKKHLHKEHHDWVREIGSDYMGDGGLYPDRFLLSSVEHFNNCSTNEAIELTKLWTEIGLISPDSSLADGWYSIFKFLI